MASDGRTELYEGLQNKGWKVDRVAAVYQHTGPNNSIELLRPPVYLEPNTYYGGLAGLNSTVEDYFLFQQMMLNGGELNGVRFFSPRTINLMISNHIGDKDVYVSGPGYGRGLGYCILMDPGKATDSHQGPFSGPVRTTRSHGLTQSKIW